MAQLSANQVNQYDVGDLQSLPVADNVVIWKGSAIGSSGGYARQLVANDIFLGFADQHIDNTVSGHTAGGMNVPVISYGRIQLSVPTAAVTDLGAVIYASDGNTFTKTSTGNSRVGVVCRFISAGVVLVDFDASVNQKITQGA